MPNSETAHTTSLTNTFSKAKPQISAMAQQFMVARDAHAHDKTVQDGFDQKQDEIKLRSGDLSSDQVSRIANVPRSILIAQAEKKRRAKDAHDQIIYMNMIDDMRNRLADLEQRMSERLNTLRDKYGEDVAGSMAATFLTEEERAGLNTDKQLFQALADKFIDGNGEIKAEYKHLGEAIYVQDWNEAHRIKQTLDKYGDKSYLSDHEAKDVTEVAKSLGLARQEDMHLQSNNAALKATVGAVMNENRQTQAQHDNGVSPIAFGK